MFFGQYTFLNFIMHLFDYFSDIQTLFSIETFDYMNLMPLLFSILTGTLKNKFVQYMS